MKNNLTMFLSARLTSLECGQESGVSDPLRRNEREDRPEEVLQSSIV